MAFDIHFFIRIHACKGFALDYNPLGYHGFPKGNNQALRAGMPTYALCFMPDALLTKNKAKV